MISSAAVEAAALAAFDWDYGVDDWTIVPDQTRSNYLAKARAVLEAAIPHLAEVAYRREGRKPGPIYPLGKIEDKRQ